MMMIEPSAWPLAALLLVLLFWAYTRDESHPVRRAWHALMHLDTHVWANFLREDEDLSRARVAMINRLLFWSASASLSVICSLSFIAWAGLKLAV